MRKVFALQHNARAPSMGGEAGRFRERRGASHKVAQQFIKLRLEGRIRHRGVVRGLQFFQCRHQCLWHIATAEATKAAAGIRNGGRGLQGAHENMVGRWLRRSRRAVNNTELILGSIGSSRRTALKQAANWATQRVPRHANGKRFMEPPHADRHHHQHGSHGRQ